MRIFTLISAFAALVAPAISVGTGSGLDNAEVPLSVTPLDMITHIGMIEVHDSDDKLLGYISKDLCAKALACYNPSVKDALVVTFTTNRLSTGLSTELDLTATNLNPAYPFLGIIQGALNTDSDLRPKSYQYLYLGGIQAPGTQPGAPPSQIGNSYNDFSTDRNRTAESAVWTYDTTSRVLTPQWINTDGSPPHEEFFALGTALYIGGSQDTFRDEYRSDISLVRAETCLRICLDSPHEEFWDLGGVLYVGRNGAGTLLREECDSVTTVKFKFVAA